MKYLSLLILTFSPLLFGMSGRVVGNGGDIIVCYNQSQRVTSFELLDYYESRTLRELDLDLGETHLPVMEKVYLALNRLEKFSPQRTKLYSKYAASFFDETKFVSNIDLSDISDSEHILIPKNCKIQQIANQSPPLLPQDKRYLIDLELWNLLDSDQQAGLILHEIIYREAIELGHINSISSRYLNGVISSNYLKQMSLQEFINLLYQLDFNHLEVQGALLTLKENIENGPFDSRPLFYQNGHLKIGKVKKGSSFFFKGQGLKVRDNIDFHPNGVLKSLYLQGRNRFQINHDIFHFSPQKVHFYENGNLKKSLIEKPLLYKKSNVEIKVIGQIEFHKKGQLRFAELVEGVWFFNNNPIRVSNLIEFHPSGNIKKVDLLSSLPLKIEDDLLIFKGSVEFYPGGNIKQGYIQGITQTLAIQNKRVDFSSFYPLTFHPQKKLKSAYLAQKVTLKLIDGSTKTFQPQTKVFFNLKGLVQVQM